MAEEEGRPPVDLSSVECKHIGPVHFQGIQIVISLKQEIPEPGPEVLSRVRVPPYGGRLFPGPPAGPSVAPDGTGPLELQARLIDKKAQRDPGRSRGLFRDEAGSRHIAGHHPVLFRPDLVFGQYRERLDVFDAFQIPGMKPDLSPLFAVERAVLLGMAQQGLQSGELVCTDRLRAPVLGGLQQFQMPQIGA